MPYPARLIGIQSKRQCNNHFKVVECAQLAGIVVSHRWVVAGLSVPLLYIAFIAAQSVGAIAPNNSTNSISEFQTLPLGIFTLPLSLIVTIARSIPIHIKWQIFRLLYPQTLIYRVRVLCLLPWRKSALL